MGSAIEYLSWARAIAVSFQKYGRVPAYMVAKRRQLCSIGSRDENGQHGKG
jgi:hypothetical protein